MLWVLAEYSSTLAEVEAALAAVHAGLGPLPLLALASGESVYRRRKQVTEDKTASDGHSSMLSTHGLTDHAKLGKIVVTKGTTCVCACRRACLYACLYACVRVCVRVCMHVRVRVRACVCVSACLCGGGEWCIKGT